jgi:hypothetical protein
MATIDLNELRKEIEVDRKNLSDKEAVLRYLENKEDMTHITANSKLPNPPLHGGVILLDQLQIPQSNRRTLLDDAEDVVKRFGDQEFSVAHVDIVFQQQGIKSKGENIPRSRISTALGKLEEAGVIKRTFTGGGNAPHRYKIIKGDVNDLL